MPNANSCELLTIGEIVGVHGIKGYVKIKSFAESFDIFYSGRSLFIGSGKSLQGEWFKLVKSSFHKKGMIALFENVNRESAETLVGKLISVSKFDLPELESDTYYWQDLIGVKVTDIKLGFIGFIDHIIPTGSNDVFVVKSNCRYEQEECGYKEKAVNYKRKSKNREILIPALSCVILSVDLDSREMSVNLPHGLQDDL